MIRRLTLASFLFWAAVLSASQVTLRLVSFDGPFVNGIPTYPYSLVGAGSVPFWAMCDDYYHDGTPGDTWLANLTNLGTGNLTYLRFASSGLVDYREAGWILLETQVTMPTQWPDMNYAVWHIFNPTVPIDSQAQLWITAAQQQAQQGFPGVDFYHVEIGTPIDINAPPTGDQEFMWIVPGSIFPVVPEPGSLILLATGALGLAGVLRRKYSR
ncbi:MAG: PEP-CTERM sorting domain-containing protein [Candidatus Korobacteraceae bacterium]